MEELESWGGLEVEEVHVEAEVEGGVAVGVSMVGGMEYRGEYEL